MVIDLHTHQQNPPHAAIRNLFAEEAPCIGQDSPPGFFSVGLHPLFIVDDGKEQMQKIEETATCEQVKAIGECGMDKAAGANAELQLTLFEAHVQLAEKLQKPLIIHCVGFFNELFALKKRINPTQQWIIHGFRGKPELAKQALKAGFGLSFGEKFNPASLLLTPPEQLYAETDESKLAFAEICRRITEITGIEPELFASSKLFSS